MRGEFLIKNLHFPDNCQLVKVINFRTYCCIEGGRHDSNNWKRYCNRLKLRRVLKTRKVKSCPALTIFRNLFDNPHGEEQGNALLSQVKKTLQLTGLENKAHFPTLSLNWDEPVVTRGHSGILSWISLRFPSLGCTRQAPRLTSKSGLVKPT